MKQLFTITPNDLKEALHMNRKQRINTAAQAITAFIDKEMVKLVGVLNEGKHGEGPIQIHIDNDLLHDHFCYQALSEVVDTMKSHGYKVEYRRSTGYNMQDDETNVLTFEAQ